MYPQLSRWIGRWLCLHATTVMSVSKGWSASRDRIKILLRHSAKLLQTLWCIGRGTLQANVQIALYDDRVVVTSPGSLPAGLTTEQYLYGQISVLRNPIVAEVFLKLDYIEKFGTGIARIRRAYRDSINQSVYQPCLFEAVLKALSRRHGGRHIARVSYRCLRASVERPVLPRKGPGREPCRLAANLCYVIATYSSACRVCDGLFLIVRIARASLFATSNYVAKRDRWQTACWRITEQCRDG